MPDELITIATFASAPEASPVQTTLEAAGIRTFVQGGTSGDILSLVGSALGGVKLQVASNDVQRARECLGWSNEDENNQPIDAWDCGACGEHVDAGFAVCWNCGTSFDENPQAQPIVEEELTPAPDQPSVTCPMCGERLPENAEECRHCGEQFDPSRADQSRFVTSDIVSGEEPPEYVETARALLNRAFRAAVLGVVLCPPFLSIYSMMQLAQYQQMRRDYQLDREWRLTATYIFNTIAVVDVILFILLFTGIN